MAEFAPHNMTAANAPVYFTATASSEFSASFAAWKAFDGDPATYWIGTGGGVDQISLDIGSPSGALISGYGIQVNQVPEPNRAPKDWALEGSNDGSSWTAVDTETAQTAWASGQRRDFSASPAGIYYRYFRVNMTANNGDATYIQIAEVYLQGTVAPGGDVLVTRVSRQDTFSDSDVVVTGARRQDTFTESDMKMTGMRRQDTFSLSDVKVTGIRRQAMVVKDTARRASNVLA